MNIKYLNYLIYFSDNLVSVVKLLSERIAESTVSRPRNDNEVAHTEAGVYEEAPVIKCTSYAELENLEKTLNSQEYRGKVVSRKFY